MENQNSIKILIVLFNLLSQLFLILAMFFFPMVPAKFILSMCKSHFDFQEIYSVEYIFLSAFVKKIQNFNKIISESIHSLCVLFERNGYHQFIFCGGREHKQFVIK